MGIRLSDIPGILRQEDIFSPRERTGDGKIDYLRADAARILSMIWPRYNGKKTNPDHIFLRCGSILYTAGDSILELFNGKKNHCTDRVLDRTDVERIDARLMQDW